jgi:hypothetical protein
MIQPIDLSTLSSFRTPHLTKQAANERYAGPFSAKAARITTAFLCHSHHDRNLVEKLVALFAAAGVELYVDWQDHTMPPTPTKQTAEKIQAKIRDLDIFLYLATPNSSNSKWCPWEIGFGDSAKGKEKILVVPTRSSTGIAGQEYLSLYRSIQIENGKLVRYDPVTGQATTWNP